MKRRGGTKDVESMSMLETDGDSTVDETTISGTERETMEEVSEVWKSTEGSDSGSSMSNSSVRKSRVAVGDKMEGLKEKSFSSKTTS